MKSNPILSAPYSWNSHLKIHTYFLEQLVTCIQEVVDHSFSFKSISLFLSVTSEIKQHIRFEEKCIIPLFASKEIAYISFGKPDYYLSDHQKLNHLFNELTTDFFHQDKIQLLKKLYKLYDLLEHHDTRENEALYNLLEPVLTSAEKEYIEAQFKVHIKPLQSSSEFKDVVLLLPIWRNEQIQLLSNKRNIFSECFVDAVARLSGTSPIRTKFKKLIEMNISLLTVEKIKQIRQIDSVLFAYYKHLINSAETLNT